MDPTDDTSSESLFWVSVSGDEIPFNAIQGGFDNDEPLYIGRAHHEGALIPGKVVPSHKVCYVTNGGAEIAKSEYEILCNPVHSGGSWVECKGAEVPDNAFQGGHTEDGEPLYIGHVSHDGTLSIGKVQKSHGVCYIPYAGEELHFSEYEVFIE